MKFIIFIICFCFLSSLHAGVLDNLSEEQLKKLTKEQIEELKRLDKILIKHEKERKQLMEEAHKYESELNKLEQDRIQSQNISDLIIKAMEDNDTSYLDKAKALIDEEIKKNPNKGWNYVLHALVMFSELNISLASKTEVDLSKNTELFNHFLNKAVETDPSLSNTSEELKSTYNDLLESKVSYNNFKDKTIEN